MWFAERKDVHVSVCIVLCVCVSLFSFCVFFVAVCLVFFLSSLPDRNEVSTVQNYATRGELSGDLMNKTVRVFRPQLKTREL